MKVKTRIPVPSAIASSGHWSKNADGEWGFDLSDNPIEDVNSGVSKLNVCSDEDDDETQSNDQNTVNADNTTHPTNRKASTPNQNVAQKASDSQGSRKNSESVTNATTNIIEQSSPAPVHLVLRMRDIGKDLQDIKFDFLPNKDTVDGISHELVNAKLIDAIDMIAVSANLNKLLENYSLSPITFPLVRNIRFFVVENLLA